MSVERLKRSEPSQMNYYPFIMDYDFVKQRPRGGSACIDLFSSGRLCSVVNDAGGSDMFYVQKNDIAPTAGFFLLDFAKVKKNPSEFIDILKGMNLSDIYMEDSKRYSLDKIFAGNKDFNLILVSFAE